MRRTISFGLAVASLIAVGVFPGLASAQGQNVRDGKIRVLGRATVEVAPDFVVVRVGVSTRAANPTAALDQNSAAATKILQFAKTFGIDQSDIRTDSVNLTPVFKQVRDRDGNFRQEPDGYGASNTVRVKLKDISRLGTFMREVLDQGATNIGGVQFGIHDPEKASDDVRRMALEDARRKARQLAEVANVKLGLVQEISQPPRTTYHAPTQFAADAPVARFGEVPIAAGNLQLTAEVDVTWTIE